MQPTSKHFQYFPVGVSLIYSSKHLPDILARPCTSPNFSGTAHKDYDPYGDSSSTSQLESRPNLDPPVAQSDDQSLPPVHIPSGRLNLLTSHPFQERFYLAFHDGSIREYFYGSLESQLNKTRLWYSCKQNIAYQEYAPVSLASVVVQPNAMVTNNTADHINRLLCKHIQNVGTVLIATCGDPIRETGSVKVIFLDDTGYKGATVKEVLEFSHMASVWGVDVHPETGYVLVTSNAHDITLVKVGDVTYRTINQDLFHDPRHELGQRRSKMHLTVSRKCLQRHRHNIPAVAISPSGSFAVSGSIDCTMRLWDLQNMKQIGLKALEETTDNWVWMVCWVVKSSIQRTEIRDPIVDYFKMLTPQSLVARGGLLGMGFGSMDDEEIEGMLENDRWGGRGDRGEDDNVEEGEEEDEYDEDEEDEDEDYDELDVSQENQIMFLEYGDQGDYDQDDEDFEEQGYDNHDERDYHDHGEQVYDDTDERGYVESGEQGYDDNLESENDDMACSMDIPSRDGNKLENAVRLSMFEVDSSRDEINDLEKNLIIFATKRDIFVIDGRSMSEKCYLHLPSRGEREFHPNQWMDRVMQLEYISDLSLIVAVVQGSGMIYLIRLVGQLVDLRKNSNNHDHDHEHESENDHRTLRSDLTNAVEYEYRLILEHILPGDLEEDPEESEEEFEISRPLPEPIAGITIKKTVGDRKCLDVYLLFVARMDGTLEKYEITANRCHFYDLSLLPT